MANKKPLANLPPQDYAKHMVERAKIRAFCTAVAKRFQPRKIILFGSYAYGKPTEDSDVDLLVVMNRTRYRGERMSLRIRLAIPAGFPRPAGADSQLHFQAGGLGRLFHPGNSRPRQSAL
jgi:predicted nucleotidyltransferase